MKSGLTILVLFISCFLSVQLEGSPYRGFLMTKNGKTITGFIGGVSSDGKMSRVLFINDFGNLYVIEARQIKGFAYQKDEEVVFFESKRDQKKWLFLMQLYRGEEAKLYKAPPPDPNQLNLNLGIQLTAQHSNAPKRYYLQLRNGAIKKVTSFRFRHKMRRLLQEQAPDVALQIGQPGYRFKNLESIVEQLDKSLKKTRYKI